MTTITAPAPHAEEHKRHLRKDLPAPRADQPAYDRERRLALATSPRRLLNYVRYRLSQRAPQVHYLPLKLDIENVSRCNFHCVMCQVSDWWPKKRGEDMSLDDFRKLIDSQHGVYEIKIQGLGEPTLQGDAYFDMIRYARSKHIWVRTTTNASLLHVNDNARKLVDSDVNEIQISFDGATKETFEKIRRGSKFEQVTANCKLINAYCAEKGVLKTRMWVVLQDYNFAEFHQFVQIAAEMGFKRLTFALNLNGFSLDRWEEKNNAVSVEERFTLDMAWDAVARGAQSGVEVTFWNITEKYDTDRPENLCPWPFERAFVSSDMRIVPCCMIANPDVSDLGDARKFNVAWRSEDYQEFRKAHLEGRVPRVCQGCYVAKRGP